VWHTHALTSTATSAIPFAWLAPGLDCKAQKQLLALS